MCCAFVCVNRVSKAQADAAEARSKLAEARKQLVVTQQGIEQELRVSCVCLLLVCCLPFIECLLVPCGCDLGLSSAHSLCEQITLFVSRSHTP